MLNPSLKSRFTYEFRRFSTIKKLTLENKNDKKQKNNRTIKEININNL